MLVDLNMQCPVCAGANKRKWIAHERWIHSGCGGILAIDEYGYIHCRKCGKKVKATQMKLRCRNGRHKFSVPNDKGIATAITTAEKMTKYGGMAWIKKMLTNI
jgi:Zn finger protein HypA/HybF involved in hydrogenase expression